MRAARLARLKSHEFARSGLLHNLRQRLLVVRKEEALPKGAVVLVQRGDGDAKMH